MKKLVSALLVCVMLASVLVGGAAAQSVEGVVTPAKVDEQNLHILEKKVTEINKDKILLKSRQFIPSEGISEIVKNRIIAKAPKKTHVLLQFNRIPTKEEKKELEKEGITLLSYIPNKAWFASIPGEKPGEIAALPNVRAIAEILPEDKIFPAILERGIGPLAVNDDGTVNLEVSFFKDFSLIEARSLMVGMGAVIKEESEVSNRLTVTISADRLMDIANEDVVRWIIEERPPKIELNDGSRANVGADAVQASPYNLRGSGVDVGIWDGGDVDSSHDDFGSRVTIVDAAGVTNHATHVAGTMGGDGTRSQSEGGTAYQWKGMAPQMDIISYYWDNHLADHDPAINTYGIEISQNSWGYNLVGPPAYPEYYGYYGWDAPEYDDIVTGLYGKRISVVFAAGNDRDNVPYDYDTIGPPSTAKNMICVGAINSDDDSMTVFSGWGPTDDGRIKPDVVAPGDEVGGDGGIKSTFTGNTYGVYIGTSMAAPCVSGSASLIIEDYRSRYSGQDPLPSTVKALLMHEAKDLGNIGPDYSYGYGDIQIQDSIDKLRTDSLVEDDVGPDGTDTYTLYVPEGTTTEVKITLVWDDEPATEGAATTLVNDLDLIVKDPNNVRYYPWTLNPSSPSDFAVQTQEDHTNNVEQVVVDESIISGDWTIEVEGDTVPYAPQKYSLIFTPNYGVNVVGEIYKDSGYSEEEIFFDSTETVYIEAYVVSQGSPLTGAEVTADLKLSDGSTAETITLADAGGGYYRNPWDSTGQTPDIYLVDITVADPQLNTQEYFHLYPESGVSAYRLDYDGDGNDDYILENKHLIAVFDGKEYTDQSLLYLYQKDTNVSYTFGSISDSDSSGRGEVTTSNMKDIQFYSFSISQEGENLAGVDLDIKTNVTDPTPGKVCFVLYTKGSPSATYETPYINLLTDIGYTVEYNTASCNYDGGDIKSKTADFTGYDFWAHSYLYDNSVNALANAKNYYVDQLGNNELIFGYDVAFIGDFGYATANPATYANTVVVYVIKTNSVLLGTDYSVGQTVAISKSAAGCAAAPYCEFVIIRDDMIAGLEYWLDHGTVESATYDFETTYEAAGGGRMGAIGIAPKALSNGITTNADAEDNGQEIVQYLTSWLAVPPVPKITTSFNLTVKIKSEDVDYLVYKLHNFDQNISDINDIFPDIAGTFGLNVSDDRYHSEDGSDDLITSLTANQWNNYTNSNYSIVYDNSTSADSTDNNVIALVRFNETADMEFDSSGLWYDNSYDTEGLRMRYNTSLATPSDEINYILAFTKGDWQTIDQWMPNIAQGQFPTPNFMTAAVGLNVVVNPNIVSFENVLAGNSTEIHVSLILNNTGSVPAMIKAVFKTNVSDVYGLMNGTSGNIIPGNNFKLGPDGNETALTNTTTTTDISTLAAGENEIYNAILIVPAGQAANDYNGIVELIIEQSS